MANGVTAGNFSSPPFPGRGAGGGGVRTTGAKATTFNAAGLSYTSMIARESAQNGFLTSDPMQEHG